ncbi:NPCBM/NEW2 domain-containing protein [Chengkuizengella axinellae]|uniref:NPCBM/NEW2 domain-containing protein n=1 Tax=Chengkuizengella axinellae TaxID=3064388 RepID=UPI003527E91E
MIILKILKRKIIVYGDGVELFRSSDLVGGDLAEEISIDIEGVLKLQIQFDTENYYDIGILLADAKLIK